MSVRVSKKNIKKSRLVMESSIRRAKHLKHVMKIGRGRRTYFDTAISTIYNNLYNSEIDEMQRTVHKMGRMLDEHERARLKEKYDTLINA